MRALAHFLSSEGTGSSDSTVRSVIDPMQVFKDHHQRLFERLAQ
jgi:hypothetical protein